ncbi:hypothetical protein GCM10018785_06230 [Streptomyces longispororuber]|uniref:Uncharacterized protein n=1 Tax=Streptomyces longispororuber TaxID=68230 RepID=A0A918Z6G2_9ACTN|nr:hypothetical protein GCM10018785_06230 [Streptomyces longispororuber]
MTEEAERLIRDQVWVLTSAERYAAAKAAAELRAAVGAEQSQQSLSQVDRLAHLRGALAAVAIALAHVHGRLAWFFGAAATALTPVLHWRAVPAEDGPTFGAVPPTPEQYTEAEEAVRRLESTLVGMARIGTA